MRTLNNVIWEIDWATDVEDNPKAGQAKLDRLLADGWEPYATIPYGSGYTKHWLRRQVERPLIDFP